MAKAYGFDESGIRRIRALMRREERAPRVGSQRRRIQPVLGSGANGIAVRITKTLDDDEVTPTWISRTRFDEGFPAVGVEFSNFLGETGTEITLFCDFSRSIFTTGDVVVAKNYGGKWQIRDEGITQWTGVAAEDIDPTGDVLIETRPELSTFTSPTYVRVPGELYDPQESVSEGSSCLVLWIDGERKFRVIPVACPAQVVEEI